MVAACLAMVAVLIVWSAGNSAPAPRSPRHAADLPAILDAPKRAPAIEKPSEATRDDRVRVTGSIVLIDGEGNERLRESGNFRLRVWEGVRGTSQVVNVNDGNFTVLVPGESQLSIDRVVLGGRPIKNEYRRLAIPADRRLTLRANLTPRAVLRVVDAAAGNDLNGVVIVNCIDWRVDEFAHPGTASIAPVVMHARSPVELPDDTGTESYWVRATGFAWKRVAYDHDAGGERIVKLEPGGAVDVRLDNFDPKSKAVVRFRGAGTSGQPVLQAKLDERGRCTIEDLVPGDYEVQVQIGAWYDEPRTLGQGRVTVEAGARRVVEITLKPPRDLGSPVMLRGTLVLPAAWKQRRPTLSVESVGPDHAERDVDQRAVLTEGASGQFEWKLGKVPPGRYMVEVDPLQYRLAFQVERGVSEHVLRIEVPQPATVTVEIVDGVSGDPVKVEGIAWHTPFAPASGGALESVHGAPADSFTFQVPVGLRVFVELSDAGFDAEDVELHIQSGRNRLKLEVRRVIRFRLIVRDGSATVPLGHEFEVTVEHIGGDGKVAARWSDDTTSTFHVTAAGRYRLKFGPIEGYESLADKIIELAGNGVQDVIIAVTRAGD